ncbi:synaptotagmin-6-like [Mya arenaria]|uniref:synaptotagmin-6-like n=1 Tax=Mya arenaria TaxID=6604 RepID=UPI0022E4B714|nr:synaptotagmin-6-like [Mya arenaria]
MNKAMDKTDAGVPVMYIVIAIAISITLVSTVIGYVAWIACKGRRQKRQVYWKKTYKETSSPESILDHNLKISKSTPDLTFETDILGNESRYSRAKSFFQALRQSTMPTVSERHQLFHRHMSHQIDLSKIEFSVQSAKHTEQPSLGVIKPELYKQVSVDSVKSEHLVCGQLQFSLQYSYELNQITIGILKAINLPPKDFSGTSDPYIKTYLLPDRRQKYQSKVHRKTLNPEFNEKYTFNVPFSDLHERVLHFNIYDFDRFSRHDLIGTVTVPDIVPEGNRLVTETFFVRDILSSYQEKFDLGEIMLTLCYLPTAGRLTLTAVKARSLKAMDITGSSDPFVKASLVCEGKRIKKKKTTVKRNTLNPVYNEAMVFDVPRENVEDVDIIIKVIDYDRIGRNEIMGCFGVGPRFTGTGRDHWYEMLENPRKPVAQWYTLQEHVHGQDLKHGGRGCFRYRQATTDSTCSEASM